MKNIQQCQKIRNERFLIRALYHENKLVYNLNEASEIRNLGSLSHCERAHVSTRLYVYLFFGQNCSFGRII